MAASESVHRGDGGSTGPVPRSNCGGQRCGPCCSLASALAFKSNASGVLICFSASTDSACSLEIVFCFVTFRHKHVSSQYTDDTASLSIPSTVSLSLAHVAQQTWQRWVETVLMIWVDSLVAFLGWGWLTCWPRARDVRETGITY